jgi:protein SCO1/2
VGSKTIAIISILVLALIAFNIGLGNKNIAENKSAETESNTSAVSQTSETKDVTAEFSANKDASGSETTDEVDSEKSEPIVGGDYELIDKNGTPVKSEQFLGKKQIIFFGFTNCPMICPTAINSISILMNELGDAANGYVPIFISTDPERDTPARLTDYFANMHPSFVALTGTVEQAEQAKKVFKVYSAKVANPNDPANYDMNHSSIIYVLDEQGKYLTHFSHETPVEVMAEKLKGYEK